MIKGVIFDLDGTLIDSMGIWNRIDKKFLRENGIENPPENISDIVREMSVEESANYFIESFGLDCTVDYVINRIEALVKIYYEELIALKSGALEILDYLDESGIPYGVATATYRSLAEAVLKRHGILSRFRFILTDADYPAGKNSPDIFLGCAERLGFSPSELLVAEDSLHCIETAASAGFITAGIYDSISDGDYEKIRQTATFTADSLNELVTIIEKGTALR